MYGIDPAQLLHFVIRPALRELGSTFSGLAAERLVLGTALVESRARYLHQLGGGPALGLWQMEPATHDDIWQNWLRFQGPLLEWREKQPAARLIYDLQYAAQMCRHHYRRVSEALPPANDALRLSRYWKAHYNTHKGAGTVEKALPHFEVAINV